MESESKMLKYSTHTCWGSNKYLFPASEINQGKSTSHSYQKKILVSRFGDNDFFFITGARIGLFNIASSKSILLQTLSNLSQYLSLHVSPTNKFLLSSIMVFSQQKDEAFLLLYDFPKSFKNFSTINPSIIKRKSVSSDILQYEFKNITFFSDGQFFACSTTDVKEGVIVYNTVRGDIVTQIPLANQISSIHFHPVDSTKLCITGDDMFIFWRYTKNNIHSAPILGLPYGSNDTRDSSRLTSRVFFNDNQVYTCHAWISDNLVVAGNKEGTIFLVQGCEVIYRVKEVFKQVVDNSETIQLQPFHALFYSNDQRQNMQVDLSISDILVRGSLIVAVSYTSSMIAVFELKKFISSSRQGISARLIPIIRQKLVSDEVFKTGNDNKKRRKDSDMSSKQSDDS